MSADGKWAHCTQEQFAGEATYHPTSQTYAHKSRGQCPCGTEHAPADDRNGFGSGVPEIDCTYDYKSADGGPLFQVARRRNPKTFRQRRPDSKGGWIWNLKGVEPVLYRLPELLAADPAETVYVVEGEKDCDRLRSEGLVATCNPMGAGKWRESYSKALTGRKVVILPDADKPGRDHAATVDRSASAVAASVTVVEIPDLPEHGDVSDFLNRGGTVEQLRELVEHAGRNGATTAPSRNSSSPGDDRHPAPEGGSVSFVSGQDQESPNFTGPPRPLVTILRPVPSFHPELLPPPLRPWVLDITDRKQCAIEFVAVAAVVALAAVVGRKVGIRPKRHDVWTVVANLWGMIVGRPGMLKTPALDDALLPLKRLAARSRKQHETDMEEYHRQVLVAEAKQKAAKDSLQKAARKSVSDSHLLSLAGQAAAVAELPAPVARRYMTNDTTVEKLGELLVDLA